MSDFITLTCPNCSGKLQITNDINRFACMYCGVEHVVRRGGGIVTLQPVVDELKKVNTGISGVKVGVDRTASELAIQRLQVEIAELTRKRDRLVDALFDAGLNRTSPAQGNGILLAKTMIIWLSIFGLTAYVLQAITTNGVISGSFGLLLSVGSTYYLYFRNRNRTRLAELQLSSAQYNRLEQQVTAVESEIAQAKRELARHKQLVRQIDN